MTAQAPLIALAAGGTGGHMFPAQALAEELKRRGFRVMLVTDARGARFAAAFPADERLEISAASPSVKGLIAKIAAVAAIASGFVRALMEFRRRKVAAAVGFGGYPSLPAMKAASVLQVPYGVHEQNGVLGRANRQLIAGAAFLAHAFPVLERVPNNGAQRQVEVGNPLRDAVAALAGAPFEAPGDNWIRILVFGGSQGAALFSRVVPEAIAGLPAALRSRLNVVQQARDAEAGDVAAMYHAAGVPAEIAPFFTDLPERLAAAHLVICRSGASTVTELAAIGRPAVFAPLAIAMDDHQTGNARVLADAGAALIIPESGFTPAGLRDAIEPLLSSPALLAQMAEQARGRVRLGAASALADLVESLPRSADGVRAA